MADSERLGTYIGCSVVASVQARRLCEPRKYASTALDRGEGHGARLRDYLGALVAPQALDAFPVEAVPEVRQVALLAPEPIVAEPGMLKHADAEQGV